MIFAIGVFDTGTLDGFKGAVVMGCKSHLEMLFTYHGSRNYLGLILLVVCITRPKH